MKQRICIVVEGGVVQSVVTDGDPNAVDVAICDYAVDQEIVEPLDTAQVPQTGGGSEPACVGRMPVDEASKAFMDLVFK